MSVGDAPFEPLSGRLPELVPASVHRSVRVWRLTVLIGLLGPAISLLLVLGHGVLGGAWGFLLGSIVYLGARFVAVLGVWVLAERMAQGRQLAYQMLPVLGVGVAIWALMDRGAMFPVPLVDTVLIVLAWLNVAITLAACGLMASREARDYFR